MKQALKGTGHVFGAGLTFDEPSKPDLVIDTESESEATSIQRLLRYVGLKG